MQGTIAIIWDGEPGGPGRAMGGVLTESHRGGKSAVVAHPGEKIYVDSVTAERYVRAGKAHYPRN